MVTTLPNAAAASPREKLAEVCGAPVKADLHPHAPAIRLREVAADALQNVTSQKAAAIDLDLSEGRLSHKLTEGTLTIKQQEALGLAYALEYGRLLLQAYGAVDPVERLRRELRAARTHLDAAADLAGDLR